MLAACFLLFLFMKKINIGITVGAELDNPPSVWSSGAWQNIIFLYFLLKNSDKVGEVHLVNYAGKPSHSLDVGHNVRLPLIHQDDVIDRLDVLMIMGIQIGQEAQKIRDKGIKMVAFHVGNHYIITLENILFDLERGGGEFDGSQPDAVWTLPHHANTCQDFFSVTWKAPCTIVPYLWNPMFIEHMIVKNHLSKTFGYQTEKEKRNVVIFEPNINVVKSSIYPLLIAELAYPKIADDIGSIHVTNTAKFHKQKAFNQFAYTLDITKKGIASYDDRYDTPSFMSLHGDIVVTHQWENGLNNLYYDVLYGRYPLVHNSPFLKDVGYYYEDFNAKEGAQRLIEAVKNHDTKAYDVACRKALYEVELDNPKNIAAYEKALEALFAEEKADA